MRKDKAAFWTLAALALALAFSLGWAVGVNANSELDLEIRRARELRQAGRQPAKGITL